MTLIVSPEAFTSKRALAACLNSATGVTIEQPSYFNPWAKNSQSLPVGFRDVVTNHPLRTKFAQIEKTANGWEVK